MEFKNYKNMLEGPFYVLAYSECSLIETGDANKVAKHMVNSTCFYLVCTYDNSKNRLWTCVGEDSMKKMIIELSAVADECIEEMRKNQEIEMTEEDQLDFENATCCSICKQEFTENSKRVRDHDHRTGKYRGCAHDRCNINYFNNRFLPVIFHNLKGYDSHLIIKEAFEINQQLGNRKIDAIPNSYEKFMSISIGDLKFIDSFQFMASSLEKLSENLYDDEDKFKNFKFMKTEFPEHYEILCQKGYYPYEWVNDIKKLNHKGLPPQSAFYSSLKQETLSDKEYKHAQNVYTTLKCKTFKDYHMAYLKCDVLLLADVFENFRKTCIEYYKLDPSNYLTAPGLAWDAMLLQTKVKLDLINDVDMLSMIERQKRGGLCFVGSKRYVKANNKYLPDYNPEEDSNYLMYWDANNLYGWAMSQSLPLDNLRFEEGTSLNKILKTPDDSHKGYIVEVDL